VTEVQQIGVEIAVVLCMIGERDEADEDVPSRTVWLRLRPREPDGPK
jgi:hypothetical protein